MAPNRRTVLVGLGSGIAGIVGASAFSQNTEAASVDIDSLNIPNKDKTVSQPVQNLELTVSGTWSYETSVIPDSVILRLEGKYGSEWQQLDATRVMDNLTKSSQRDYALTGGLIDLNQLGHGDISPESVGAEKSVSIDIRVGFAVIKDGRTLHEKYIKDAAQITIKKGLAKVTSELTGSGSVSVVT